MQYAVADMTTYERYKLLAAFIVPRPIAWVTTMGPTGVVNVAPFSFFNVFAEDPPIIMIGIGKRPDGRVKDTQVNIERTGEFVVNLADEAMAQAMHDSGGDFPPNVSEAEYLKLKTEPSVDVGVPRLTEAPWSLECQTRQVIDIEDCRRLVVGEGLRIHVRDDLWDTKKMRVDMERYKPIGRMFADRYCRTGDIVRFAPSPVVKRETA